MNDLVRIEFVGKYGIQTYFLTRMEFILYLVGNEIGSPTTKQILRRILTTDEERRYADFFTHGYQKGKDIENLPMEKLQEWIQTLESIIFEAKAKLHGADKAF